MIQIYIPIWFYFNLCRIKRFLRRVLFTFQYGSTSIVPDPFFLGSLHHLHSNMVLLQFKHFTKVLISIRIYIPIWFYFNIFRFDFTQFRIFIYIPIWFYFNCCLAYTLQYCLYIYIPIWFYFNQSPFPPKRCAMSNLYSNMVLLQ